METNNNASGGTVNLTAGREEIYGEEQRAIGTRTWINMMLGCTNITILFILLGITYNAHIHFERQSEKLLNAISNVNMSHQDKAFVNSVLREAVKTTNDQTAYWNQYFSSRDKLAEDRRESNKRFMNRTESTLTSINNRLILLENNEVGGG